MINKSRDDYAKHSLDYEWTIKQYNVGRVENGWNGAFKSKVFV